MEPERTYQDEATRDLLALPWEDHQSWERSWWGDCVNTYGEETKQLSYAHRMGLVVVDDGTGRWPVYDLGGKGILDLGGGPSSILLKTVNRASALVVDPQDVPEWVKARYEAAGIVYVQAEAEDVTSGNYDEAWIYNVLQHVRDPEQVIARARDAAKVVRLFEWIDSPPHLGHPHELRSIDLARWLGPGTYSVELMKENGCNGYAFYGWTRDA